MKEYKNYDLIDVIFFGTFSAAVVILILGVSIAMIVNAAHCG